MSGWLTAAAVVAAGGLLVWLAAVVADYLPARSVQATPPRPVAPKPQVRAKAADILGYREAGRWVPPVHPATRGAASSVDALAAWERGR